MNYLRGSEWRKWDLHIHTPLSICQNYWGNTDEIWEKFILSLENLPKDVKVIWINDYYFIDGYEKVMSYKNNWRLENIDKIFPILEFRIDTFASATLNKFSKINLHIVFNIDENNLENEIKVIKDEFIWNIHLSKLYDTKKLTLDNLQKCSSDKKLKTGFAELIPSTDAVLSVINSIQWKDKTFIILWYNEWNDLEKSTQLKLEKKNLYNLTNAFFTACKNDNIEKKEEVLGFFSDNKSRKALLHSWDIHDFNFLDTYILNSSWDKKNSIKYACYTWLKSDTTFEWLKQIIFEPNERVHIWDSKPLENLSKISNIQLNIWEDVKIKTNWIDEEYNFCFSWLNKELNLNDWLNCFIWWRWSWKSTLLNMIYKKLWEWKTTFLSNNTLINYSNDQINIDHTINSIEFLAQNEVEEFATDYEKFSKAIYLRLWNYDILEECDNEIIDSIIELDENIKLLKLQEEVNNSILSTQNTLKSFTSMLEVVTWKEYKEKQLKFESAKKEYYKIDESKKRYNDLKAKLNNFIIDYSDVNPELNIYDKNFNLVIKKLNLIKDDLIKDDFKDINIEQEKKLEEWEIAKSDLEIFLSNKWISEEKLKDITKAQDEIYKLERSNKELNLKLKNINDKLSKDFFKEIDNFFEVYKTETEKWLSEVQKKLKKISDNNESLEKIELKLSFDENRVKNDLFEALLDEFREENNKINFQNSKAYDLLFKINPIDIINEVKTYKDLKDLINKNSSNYNIFLQSIFENETNFKIYKILIRKFYKNFKKYLKINILYKNRPIEQSSFWQRCTVVILIMLLFWRNPIIIDEPEAHLDSSLIANYLVDLIKIRKKERQIIFATHNANFVINWDAEQIYILENDNNKTLFTQTSIENLENREKLLSLEWWKNAFKMRWKKYS